ncbi:MAG: glycoside hydrolase family 73 protein [Schleiferiaceae bacterium]
MKTIRTIVACLLFFVTTCLSAQNSPRKAYILKYAQIAVDEMNRTGVPASITLAQGILESGNGKSDLAARSNNHFGIKCHSSWTGAKVYHDDDEKGECFRKYKKVEHSYEDHSDFLVRGARYDFLFELAPDDYKGWAKGLKKAGYATAPDYADRLISIIEQEALYTYDLSRGNRAIVAVQDSASGSGQMQGPTLNGRGKPVKSAKKRFIIHRVQRLGDASAFVVLEQGERLETIADSLHMRVAVLLDINDANWETKFVAGERIYVEYKKNRGRTKTVLVRPGQTMRDIAQQECLRLDKLYQYNSMKVGEQPANAQVLRLRPWGWFEKRD